MLFYPFIFFCLKSGCSYLSCRLGDASSAAYRRWPRSNGTYTFSYFSTQISSSNKAILKRGPSFWVLIFWKVATSIRYKSKALVDPQNVSICPCLCQLKEAGGCMGIWWAGRSTEYFIQCILHWILTYLSPLRYPLIKWIINITLLTDTVCSWCVINKLLKPNQIFESLKKVPTVSSERYYSISLTKYKKIQIHYNCNLPVHLGDVYDTDLV